MHKKLIYIGLNVDDTQYHGAAFDKETGEIVSFKCRPTEQGFIQAARNIPFSQRFAKFNQGTASTKKRYTHDRSYRRT